MRPALGASFPGLVTRVFSKQEVLIGTFDYRNVDLGESLKAIESSGSQLGMILALFGDIFQLLHLGVWCYWNLVGRGQGAANRL